MSKKKRLSPSQFAEKIGRPYQTVMTWLRKDLIEGAEKTEVGKMSIYMIPEDATYIEPIPGRPPKAAEDDQQAHAEAALTAKAATKKASAKKKGK